MASGTLSTRKTILDLLATGTNTNSSTRFQLVDGRKLSDYDEVIFAAYNSSFNTITGATEIPLDLFKLRDQIINYTTVADCRCSYGDDTHVLLWKDNTTVGTILPVLYGVKVV